MFILSFFIICIIIVIYYCYNNTSDSNIDIDKYKICIKPPPEPEDKYNIKQYDIINDNIIIHNKYKKELMNLKHNKYIIDQKAKDKEIEIIKRRNEEININSIKLKKQELKNKINLLYDNINSLKLSLKLELNNFLNDYKQKLVNKKDLQNKLESLNNDIHNNNKLIEKTILYMSEDNTTNSDEEYIKLNKEYINLLSIKNKIIQKKINLYIKINNIIN